jgi:hypothetical protein
MIRGALEVVERDHVSGWLYSGHIELEGSLVLAFIGGKCVGCGKIELPRRDLLDAKLGHGRYGFHFPIAVTRHDDLGALTVRLDNSDLCLLHGNSVVTGGAQKAEPAPRRVAISAGA